MGKSKSLQAVVNIAGAVDPSLGKAVKNATSALGKINLKTVAVTAAAAGVAAGIGGIAIATGKAVVEAGKYLLDLGKSFDDVSDTIRIGTGATGGALAALNKDFDEVYKSVPTTMQDAGKAIADYNAKLDVTGPVLQEISKQALEASNMLGEDLGGVIDSSSKAFQQWQIGNEGLSNAMDFTFKVAQSTGMGMTDLLGKVQQFGPQLQDMGYSFETATALIGKMEKAGVNTEEVLGAMKKGFTTMSKSGISAADGMAYYYEQIQNAATAEKAAAVASEIFGTRAGSTLAAAIRSGNLAVGDFTQSMLDNGETILGTANDAADFGEKLQVFKQNMEVALKPLANTVFDSINQFMPPIMDLMGQLAPALQGASEALAPLITEMVSRLLPVLQDLGPVVMDLFADLGPMVQDIFPFISGLLGELMPIIKELVPMLMGLAKNVLSKLLPPIMQLVSKLLPALMAMAKVVTLALGIIIDLLGPILDLIVKLISPILDLITTAIMPMEEVIYNLIKTALEPLGPIIEWLGDLFGAQLQSNVDQVKPIIDILIGYFSGIADGVKNSIDILKGVLTGITDFIRSVFKGDWESAWNAVIQIFATIWNSAVALFKFPLNSLIDGVNMFLGSLNNIKIPGIGINGISIPLIPRLAAGGFTDGLSFAGEAGMEAVISFDPAYRSQNLDYWAQAGQMLGATDDTYSVLSGGSTTVVYDLGGVTFAPSVTINGPAEKDSVMKQLRAYEPEFFDLLDKYLHQKEARRYGASDWAY